MARLLLMMSSVYFNDQVALETGEINYVASDGYLSAKLPPFQLTIAEKSP